MKKISITLLMLFFMLTCNSVIAKAAVSKAITDTDTSTLDSLTTEQSEGSGSISNNEETSQEPSTDSADGTTEATTEGAFGMDQDITSDLLPEVSTQGFFSKLFDKLWGAANVVQKVVFIVIIIFFVIDLLMLVASIFSKRNIGLYLVGLIICVIAALADIYAVDIVAAINSWFKN